MFKDNAPVYEFRGPWGVPIQLGGSFAFLFLFYCLGAGSPRDFGFDLAFVGLLVLSILLHELGHAWGSLIQGVRVRRIMLHGGGGFCERSVSATRYQQELIVAMGPLVTLALWAVSALVSAQLTGAGMGYGNIIWALDSLAWINLYLFIFNMIPVHPLDGGKLFELLLHRLLPCDWAIKLTGIVGVIFVAAWLPLMLFGYVGFGIVLLMIPSLSENIGMARQPLTPHGVRRS